MKIGRNQPCPCGSGKKYKHCCADKGIPASELKPKFTNLLNHDFGPPDLSETFFEQNPIKELSAAGLIHSTLVMPEIEELARQYAEKIHKDIGNPGEAERIRQASPEMLLEMMVQGVDHSNKKLLQQRLLDHSRAVMPEIISRLKNNTSDDFIETAIRVLYRSEINYAEQIMELLSEIREPYTLSLVDLLLGFIGTEEAIQPLWKHYHALKAAYPQESFEQGPLLALYEIRERFVNAGSPSLTSR